MKEPQDHRPADRRGGLWVGVLVLGVLTGAVLFSVAATRLWWLQPLASVQGLLLDRIFYTILAVTATAFVVMHLWLIVPLIRSRRRGDVSGSERPRSSRPRWMTGPASVVGGGIVLLCVIEAALLTVSEADWAKIYSAAPASAMQVEVIGRQFLWYVRYPGPDGRFGRTDPRLISASNPLGIDPGDPAGKDDVIVANDLHLVVGRPVRVRVTSVDVVHSFFLPNFRVKQDAVPGRVVEVWFTPDRPGTYQIACAQLCGVGHYTMRGNVTVESQSAFDEWIRTQEKMQASIPGGGSQAWAR